MEWSKKDIDFLIENYGKIDLKDLCKMLSNRSYKTVWHKAKTLGLKLEEKWDEKQILKFIEFYSSSSIKELLELFPGKTQSSLSHKAQRLKLKKNDEVYNYQVDDNFFEIPNPINCYVAGFIAADGCIFTNGSNQIVQITQKEKEVLEKFKIILTYNGPILTNKDRHGYPCSHLRITSSKMIKDLEKNFGIIPRKTYILKPPILSEYNSLAYITGLIDGDGCIAFRDKNNPKSISLHLCGTKEICEFVQIILKAGHLTKTASSDRNIYSLQCSHKMAREAIYKLLTVKELNGIRFSRKWDKILEYEKAVA